MPPRDGATEQPGTEAASRGRGRPALLVYCDGLCEPRNPGGIACYGFVIYREGEAIARGYGEACRGPEATNNVAEYSAAIAALARLIAMGLTEEAVEVRSDSQLLVRQMQGEYAVRSRRIAALHGNLRRLAARFRQLRWRWVPREENREADALSRRAYAEAVLLEKAHDLQVEMLQDGTLRVQSSSGRGWYHVVLQPESCECPAFQHGRRPCKHIVAARQRLSAASWQRS